LKYQFLVTNKSVFSESQVPGTDALQALYLDDQVMEFDLTPNRADALSMIGTAYEVAALYSSSFADNSSSFDVVSGLVIFVLYNAATS
jgi:phenylalanyl-tRNA synthetase beta subunit